MSPEDDDPKVADYFLVAGLKNKLCPEDVEMDLPGTSQKDPITDICVIDKTMEESCPQGFTCIEKTPLGFLADLNHGSFTAHNMFLCYRRGRDKWPLVDLGVYYEGLETVKSGISILKTTPTGRSANVNNKSGMGSFPIYLTCRRSEVSAPQSTLVVTDICVIMTNKNESPPYAYCLINKNLNKGMIGSSIFLCYKKSMRQVHSIAFKPDLLGRYPTKDTGSFPLPASVSLFCLPMGATIECWSSNMKHPLPTFSSFVLTTEKSEKVYGAVISFYESCHENRLREEHMHKLGLLRADGRRAQGEKTLHTLKAICLLSRWPLFDAFRDFLIFIYRLTVSPITHTVPIERYISHFIHRVPFPSPERPRVQYQMSPMHATVLTRPQITPIPLSGASFLSLLDDLGADNTLTLITLALLEHKILVHSLRRSEITRVAEALITLLFPFKWQCAYVPLCPLEMADILEAPCPFIVGVDSRYFDVCEPPQDVACVNLDTNSITQMGEKKITWKLLPRKPVKRARTILQSLCNEIKRSSFHLKDEDSEYMTLNPEVTRTERHLQIELIIQETVLKFMAIMMNGYRQYLLPLTEAPSIGTTDPKSLFNMQAFVQSQDRSSHRFFSMLTGTQLFAAFVEARSFASFSGGYGGDGAGKATSLVFFDECIDRLRGEYIDSVRLIEADDTLSSERTIIVMPPDEKGLPPGEGYQYTTFPELQEELLALNDEKVTDQDSTAEAKPMLFSKTRRRSGTIWVGKRTKQEMKVSQKQAKLCNNNAQMWARLLLAHTYSVWFGCLAEFVRHCHSKAAILRASLDILYLLRDLNCVPLPDETCYRVLMHLCCLYNKPVLAVRVFHFLRDSGTQLSAVTYGLYNKALLESTWPSSGRDGYMLWQKLRNVILATVYLRQMVRNLEENSISESSDMKTDADSLSQKSIEHFNTFPRAWYFAGDAKSQNKVQSLPDLVPANMPTEAVIQQTEIIADGYRVTDTTDCRESEKEVAVETSEDAPLQKGDLHSVGSSLENTKRCHSNSIVKSVIVEDVGASSDSEKGEPDLVLEEKITVKGGKKLIERMDITHLSLDPLSPLSKTMHGNNSPKNSFSEAKPSDVATQNVAQTDAHRQLFRAFSHENSVGQSKSLSDIPVKESDNSHDSQTSTPNETSRKHAQTGLLRRSFSFAPDSTFSGNLMSSGSKLNSFLKATTIGVASKAKKLAATLAKDINETVQTNLAYYTPEKFKGSFSELSQDNVTEDGRSGDENELCGSQSNLHGNNKQSSRNSTGSTVTNSGISHSTMNLIKPSLAASSGSLNSKGACEIDLTLSSCSKCQRCQCPVYDEEIMAGWMADESNLNTHCPFCNSLFVPLLYILIKNYKNRTDERVSPPSDSQVKTNGAGMKTPSRRTSIRESDTRHHATEDPTAITAITLEPLTVPYLSPLVLRKELESLIENEGMSILGEPEFVDQHPIVYWNFVWCFRRLNLPSSLYNLVLESSLLKKQLILPQESSSDPKKISDRVVIHTMWDNFRMHEDMVKPPLYWAYHQLNASSSSVKFHHYPEEFLEFIKECIITDNVRTPLLALLDQYSSCGDGSYLRRSAYREILFLVVAALGKDFIDVEAYDRVYDNVYNSLTIGELMLTKNFDKPLSSHAKECRKLFGELDLLPKWALGSATKNFLSMINKY